MRKKLTKKEYKRIIAFLDEYQGAPIDTVFDNRASHGDYAIYKVAMASFFVLYAELGLVSDSAVLPYMYDDMGAGILSCVTMGMYECFGMELPAGDAITSIGWEYVEASELIPGLLSLKDNDDYVDVYLEYVCIHNKVWEKFFMSVIRHNLTKDKLYKKIDKLLPTDFLNYHYNGDYDNLKPTSGYYCHIMGHDGYELDLTGLAFDLAFPLRCLLCEYHMFEMMEKYPQIKKEVGV